MNTAEARPSLINRTVNSEPFETFARKPLTIGGAVFLLALGLGSIEGVVEAIDNQMAKVAVLYGAQAGVELGAAGAVAYANINSRIKNRRNKDIPTQLHEKSYRQEL